MSRIDWSKAPKGYDFHFTPKRALDDGGFYMIPVTNDRFSSEAGSYILFSDMPYLTDLFIVNSRPGAAAWTGEGLPPVDMEVEAYYSRDNRPDWKPFKLKYMGEEVLVFDSGDGEVCRETEFISTLKFRPIRTPEQIAAEEREAKARAMWHAIYFNTDPAYWDRAPEGTRDTFRAAIDAGWQQVKQ
jgi:hypothetical protein